jgi:hypothetical protein
MNYDAAKVDCGRPLSFEEDAKVEQTHDACKVILHSYNRLIKKRNRATNIRQGMARPKTGNARNMLYETATVPSAQPLFRNQSEARACLKL